MGRGRFNMGRGTFYRIDANAQKLSKLKKNMSQKNLNVQNLVQLKHKKVYLWMDNIKTGQNRLQSRATFLPRPNCDKNRVAE